MASIEFEGRRLAVRDGDSVGSAMYRAGVRTFTRSLKYHRRRGLYCMTGDCPNCLVNVDGEPGIRACTAAARDGQRVHRESGWPSTEADALHVIDKLHRLLPVGFYSKTFIRPRFAWALAERVIRRATGVGHLPKDRAPGHTDARHVHTDVLVIGAGVAGLSAAKAAAEVCGSVVVCDEGRLGERIAPGEARDRIRSLEQGIRGAPAITVLDQHTALGAYEGPLVPLVGEAGLVQVHPGRVVVATGAVESHAVFPGSDLPGVWLGRGAARMAGVHGVAPGRRAVMVARTSEALEHLDTLRRTGVEIAAVLADGELAARVPPDITVLRASDIAAAEGRDRLEEVLVHTSQDVRRLPCDALVMSLGWDPRDGLLRMGSDLPLTGAGEVVRPGCTLAEAIESGRRAGEHASDPGDGEAGGGEPREVTPLPIPAAGYVCLCEDVSVADLRQAWDEGWRSSEILKRYTTATMGPCQGAMCGRHLAGFVEHASGSPVEGVRTTARPPVRPVRLQDLAGAVNEVIDRRTSLHDEHARLGARLDWSGSWLRPYRYGPMEQEYRAVRERVSVMDVGTLGKLLVAGADAAELVDRVVASRTRDLEPGRARYMLVLDEAGYVIDDGLVCSLGAGRYLITSTSGGADHMEAWLRNWADRWSLRAHVMNQTSMLGAINVAGPRARDLLSRLSDDPIDPDAIPYAGHREIRVAGVACRAIRVGFVGELSFELHHPRGRGVELWRALLEAGAGDGIRPHGLDALDVLRLEKGHLYLGQDTLPDDHPGKLGLQRSVAMDKGEFVGRVALERMEGRPLDRKLVGLAFDGPPQRGVPLHADGRIVGRVTSCAESPSLGRAIGLGWVRFEGGELPSSLRAGSVSAHVEAPPFYDPQGVRLRA